MAHKNKNQNYLHTYEDTLSHNNSEISTLKCVKCKQKPEQQFTILICDHIICGQCLNPQQLQCQYTQSELEDMANHQPSKYRHSKNKQTFGVQQFIDKNGKKLKLSSGYQGIRCPCGAITYFKNENSDQEQQYSHRNVFDINFDKKRISAKIQQRQYLSRRASTRPSTGLIYSRNTVPSFIYTEDINQKHRMNTEPQQYQNTYSELPSKLTKKSIKQRDRDKYYSPKIDYNQTNKQRSLKKQMKLVQPHQKETMQQSLYSIQNQQNLKKSLNCGYFGINNRSSCDSSLSINSPYYQELKQQLNYIRNQYQYHLNSLNKSYKQILTALNTKFNQLQETIKDLCLSNIVMGEKSNIDIGKLISARYQDDISRHISSLTQYLDNYYQLRYKQKPFMAHINTKAQQKYEQHSSYIAENNYQQSHINKQKQRREQSQKENSRSTQYLNSPIINIYARQKNANKIKCTCCNRQQPHACQKHSFKKLQKKSKMNRKNVIIQL